MIPTVIKFLTSMLGFLSVLAAQTSTKVDDEAVQLAQAIVEDPVLSKWFDGVTPLNEETGLPDGALGLITTPDEEVLQAFRQRGFDWSKVAGLLPVIVQLLGAFAK